MREKIVTLNNEKFRYSLPDIILSNKRLEGFIKTAKSYKFDVNIKSSDCSKIRGFVFSDNEFIKIKTKEFDGVENKIEVEVFVDESFVEEYLEGNIKLITNLGEENLPYSFIIRKDGFETSIGMISDLSQFVELARENSDEATKIFCSKSFKKVFLKDKKHSFLYDNLIKSDVAGIALEEFLIETNKKNKVQFSIEKKEIVYFVDKQDIKDDVILLKSTWGFGECRVYTDNENFVNIKKNIINSNDFKKGTYKLEYEIKNVRNIKKSVAMHIFVENVTNKCSFEIKCTNKEKSLVDSREENKKSVYTKFLRNYIMYSMGKIDYDRYIMDNKLLMKKIEDFGKTYRSELCKIHLDIITNERDKALKALKIMENRLDIDYTAKPLVRCMCMYFKCQIIEDNENELIKVCRAIESYYEEECHTWSFLKLLFDLDKRYIENPQLRLDSMRELLMEGCCSPMMYFEAYEIFRKDISYFKKLGIFEIQVGNWAVKNKVADEKFVMMYAQNACRIRSFNKLVYRTLESMYNKYEYNEILIAICTILIKGQLYDKKYFKWYEKAIMLNLRITGLFEGYLYSCDEDRREILPDIVFSYFLCNELVSDKKKMFLYENIIAHKYTERNMYDAYLELIKKFTLKQLKASIIDKKMKMIYKDILPLLNIENIAKELTNIMFVHHLECFNDKYIGVIVNHKVIKKEEYQPLVNKQAYIRLFSKDVAIFLVDKDGNRYLAKNEYKITELLNYDKYAEECYKYNKNNVMLLVYLSNKIDLYIKSDVEDVSIKQNIVEIEEVQEDYRNRCLYEMILQEHDKGNVELLDKYLKMVKMDAFEKKEKRFIIECFIDRKLWNEAIEFTKHYGYRKISISKLALLCQNAVENNIKADVLTEMCIIVFEKGQCTKKIVEYLLNNIDDDVRVMYRVWRIAKEYYLDTLELEEKILTYVLFTDIYLVNAVEVFYSYYMSYRADTEAVNKYDEVLIGAYLKYNCYAYIVKCRVLNERIFDIIKVENENNKNDLYTMALLKLKSEQDIHLKNDKIFIEKAVEYFMEKGIVLPFFKKFSLECMNDKYIVDYVAEQNVNVKIIYSTIDDVNSEKFTEEKMRDVFFGIRVKEFILFYGENLQYYVFEENKGDDKITESLNISVDNAEQDDETRYGKINLMLMTKAMKDETTLLELMKSLAITDFVTKNIFSPL